MTQIIQGVTETIVGTVKEDITSASNVELWINTFNITFVHDINDLELSADNGVTTVSYTLSQEESLSMCQDFVSFQLRWIDDSGNVGASARQLIPVERSEWNSEIE